MKVFIVLGISLQLSHNRLKQLCMGKTNGWEIEIEASKTLP